MTTGDTKNKFQVKTIFKLSIDWKVMPKSYIGHKFNLCIIDEVTDYLITAAICQSRSEEAGDVLIDNMI